MKHIIEFDLPYDEESLKLVQNALPMFLALESIQMYLRGQVKYADVPASAAEIKDNFHRILDTHGISHLF